MAHISDIQLRVVAEMVADIVRDRFRFDTHAEDNERISQCAGAAGVCAARAMAHLNAAIFRGETPDLSDGGATAEVVSPTLPQASASASAEPRQSPTGAAQ